MLTGYATAVAREATSGFRFWARALRGAASFVPAEAG
jgi:hypothetical protein